MPPSRRPGLSALLIGGAIVLLVSIFIGQRIGDRVLLQTERRTQVLGAQVTPVPEADASDRGELKNWKRLQVVSVATDPAFPDPRVTRPPAPPPPPVTPTPLPTPRPPRATPIPVQQPPPQSIYTSPPLPIPLVSHEPAPAETDSPTAPPPSQPE